MTATTPSKVGRAVIRVLAVFGVLGGAVLGATPAAATAESYSGHELGPAALEQGSPGSLVINEEGDIFASEWYTDRVLEFGPQRELTRTIRSVESANCKGQLDGPFGLAVDGKGDVWLADSKNNRVLEFNASGVCQLELGAKEGKSWLGYDREGAGPGEFAYPTSVAIGPGGRIWVADTANSRVEEFTAAGEYLRMFGSYGTQACGLDFPFGIAVDQHGHIWLSEPYANRAQEFQEEPESSKQAAECVKGGTLPASFPEGGVHIDAHGDVWLPEGEGTVKEYNENRELLTSFQSYGTGEGQLYGIGGLAFDAAGNAWLSTQDPGRVEEWTPYAFDDEFTGTAVNTNLWLEASGSNPSNGELECYTPANDNESGGYLTQTLQVQPQPWSCPDGSGENTYTSGAVQFKSFNFLYGTVAVRMETSGGTGSYPGIWMMGYQCQSQPYFATSYCNWPNPGAEEVDIAEFKDSNFTTVNENDIFEGNGRTQAISCTPTVTNASANFHVYELEWTASALVYKIDGVTECTQTNDVPHQPMFLIIDTAVGGTNVGAVNNATLPQTSSVNYVRVTSNGPVPNGLPVITGADTSGSTLSASGGSWTGATPATFSYQWQDCKTEGLSGTCTNITGATANTYSLKPSDVGYSVDVNVVAQTAAGAAGQVSARTATVTGGQAPAAQRFSRY